MIENACIKPFQSLIGENNSGKSNILNAIDIFLSAGSGGVEANDFNDADQPIVIIARFSIKSDSLRKIWKPYLINDELLLEKHLWVEFDEGKDKTTIKNEYHGYQADPKEWYLSARKIKEKLGERPRWKEVVKQNGLPEYFLNNGNCNAVDFNKGLSKYLLENEVEYDEPDISSTQALGLQSYVIASLPKFYLLEAQSNYSDETDRRSSNTTFRRLMADLTDRIIKNDPKYVEIEGALNTINNLLNESDPKSENGVRLESLSTIESKLKTILSNLMPSVEQVRLKVTTEDIKTIFSKGVELSVDDGVETDVLLKGHGLQRCIIFSLLQALILNERNQLVEDASTEIDNSPIILGIEEPELYIHPQLGKLFYDVLRLFSEKDQVIYTTHSPRFIDVYNYESIGIVSKSRDNGSKVTSCDQTQFEDLLEKKIFKGLTQLNSDINELFFAKKVLLVEGPEDKIAVTEVAKKLGLVSNRLEEIEITIIVAGGKQAIPFFARVLNSFSIEYAVLHDTDLRSEMESSDRETEEKRNSLISEIASGKIVTFPIKLEDTLGLGERHFKDQFSALQFLTNHENLNNDIQNVIKEALKILKINLNHI